MFAGNPLNLTLGLVTSGLAMRAAHLLAQKVFGEIVAIAQALGGTASGEHGIGSIKSALVADEISPTVMALQRNIKAVFDPNSILNPGKKFPL